MSTTPLPSTTSLNVESIVFPPSVKPPGTPNSLFLAGAGVRGLEINGNFVKFTGIGIYLEDKAVSLLAAKWKGKTAEELTDSVEFFKDIVTGPFEKFTQVTMILPLTGKQYSEKVCEMCTLGWKAQGTYTDEDATTLDKFLEVFKDENFPPGSSICFTTSAIGSLTISFTKDGVIPETAKVVLENKKLGQAVIESVIGKHGVSPAAKQSLASRLSNVIKQYNENATTDAVADVGTLIKNGL